MPGTSYGDALATPTTCLVDFENGKKVLADFGDEGNPDDDGKRIDLCATLCEDIESAEKAN